MFAPEDIYIQKNKTLKQWCRKYLVGKVSDILLRVHCNFKMKTDELDIYCLIINMILMKAKLEKFVYVSCFAF